MKENKSLLTGLVIGALIAGTLMFFFMEKKAEQTSASLQSNYETHHATLIDSVRQSGLVNVMGPLLQKVANELEQSPDRALSDGTIKQLSALSDGFKPYSIIKGDQLSTNQLSPERGHLLLMLLGMNMDSVSWLKILSTVTFANAVLKGANLSGANLTGINLSSANLQDATLNSAVIINASLRFANLQGTHLQQTILKSADATRANFSWADLNGAILDSAILSGANLSSADFGNAHLVNTTLQWANINGTLFNGANLSGTDLLGSFIEKTHFVETNLSGANFVKTVIKELDMTSANMEGVIVQDECWLSRLSEFYVEGADEIQRNYFVHKDTTNQRVKFLVQKQ